ncbi:MAG: Gfo/Idh/MocA family oxidoreductase [Candidatus Latescibacteria bacterium]|jgi:predicted dehydrogenase|nr:Gfo/Idh/MocA family oxidoreductase [Candidatus Latescibacterota bacterium]
MAERDDRARLGFIGVGGFISARHLPHAARLETCQVRALCDIDEKRLAQREAMYRPAYTTIDYRRLLEDDAIDIVVIGTKQDLHARFASEALDAGKWVLVEKPIGETLEEMDRVIQAAESSPGKLAVGHNRRFAPAIADALPLIALSEGPQYVSYRVVHPTPGKDRGFYANREKLLYEGCHMFDLANYLIGAYPTAAFASGDRLRNTCTICEYADGSRFQFLLGTIGSPQLEKESIEIYSDRGAIHLSDFSDLRVRGYRGEYDRLCASSPESPPELLEAAEIYGNDFLDVVRRNHHADRLNKLGGHWASLPLEEVRRVGLSEEAYKVSRRLRKEAEGEGTPYDWLRPNFGHGELLEHFVACFLNDTEPASSDALDASVACVTALAAIQSIDTRKLVALESVVGLTPRIDLQRGPKGR